MIPLFDMLANDLAGATVDTRGTDGRRGEDPAPIRFKLEFVAFTASQEL